MKPSTGLEDRWKYISPDGSQVFLGEDEVVTYALQVGLLDTGVDAGEDVDASEDVEDVRASEDVITREDEDVAGIHENVVARENEDVVGSHEEVVGSVCDSIRASQINTSVVMSQNTIHELFGPESDSEDDSFLHGEFAVASESEGDVEEPACTQSVMKQDVNFVPEDESLSDYESLSSGASDDEVDADSDDETPDRGVVEEDDVSSEDDVVQMDEAFV
ncbi:hypothetical protein PI124_g14261 [Phytophthora idaei]|nr:hypothetical protein PI126_g13370 [Phytophthora idaei]KAG3240860.1 hypothetical protein PI124_g14261 [Phytophthora idaei]